MKVLKIAVPAVLLLVASSAFAKEAVRVSVKNNFSDDAVFVSQSRFVSSDWFDTGTRNNDRHGVADHVYKHGPKNIRYILAVDKSATPNFSNCPVFQNARYVNGEYVTEYMNTGGSHNFGLNITVDSGYVVTCDFNRD